MAPSLLYGTAWKEDETRRLVATALRAGFRGIDTANQRKHYHEAAVGEGIAEAGVPRSELFLQTKYTFRGGQDHRLPYDPGAPIAEQVAQSFARSLEHLKTTWLDSYMLHGPSRRVGLGPDDWEAWRAMERLARDGRAKALGASHLSIDQLTELTDQAQVKPSFVQNRCYARWGWDRAVRQRCRALGIGYQAFSLLTANPEVLRSEVVAKAARRVARTPEQVVFRFAIQVGMQPLTGTTNPQHMKEDLDVEGFTLNGDEVAAIERLEG